MDSAAICGRAKVLVVVALTVAVSALGGISPASAASSDAQQTAAEQARLTGQPVVIPSMTTEHEQTFANPDGTFTLEQHAAAVRVQRSGVWVPIDTSLGANPDGSFSPLATSAAVRFSGGGTGPLATMTQGDTVFSLSWPASLAAPLIADNTATYPEVLPGVDLQVRADNESFSEFLVVKTAEAAQQPALSAIKFNTNVVNGAISASSDGGFHVKDRIGDVVMTSAAPRMWDSSGVEDGPSALRDGTAPSGPPEGSAVAPIVETLGNATITLKPTMSMLTNPSTVFPVYLDPTVTLNKTSGMQAWAMTNKSYPSTAYYKWADADQGNGYYSDAVSGTNTKRLYWQFDLTKVRGKTIIKSTFNATETYSAQCVKTQVDLYHTSSISSATTWNNHPTTQTFIGGYAPLGVRPVAGTYCSTSAQPYTLTNNAIVTTPLNKGWTYAGVMLKGQSETSNSSWHRFNSNASLSITYNTTPNAPAKLATATPASTCNTTTPSIFGKGGTTPTFWATLTDPDGSAGGNLKLRVDVHTGSTLFWSGTSTTAVAPAASTTSANNASLKIGKALVDGTGYTWRAYTVDGYTTSPVSSICKFSVDTTAPSGPEAADVTNYAASGTTAETAGPNVARSFQLQPGSATPTEIKSYRWGLNNPGVPNTATVTSTTAGTVTVTLPTVTQGGPQILYVKSYDAAGNTQTNPLAKEFFVFTTAGPTGSWYLDEGSGAVASDAVTTAPHPMSVPSTVLWGTSDRGFNCTQDKDLLFGGSGGTATTTGAPFDSTGAFTISTQVKLSGLDRTKSRIALAGRGAATSSYTLGYDAPTASWVFTVTTSDLATATPVRVLNSYLSTSTGWTNLTATYSPNSGTAWLYASDGFSAPVGTSVDGPAVAAFAATSLVVGAGVGTTNGTSLAEQYWHGELDNVRVWQGVLTSDQVNQVAAEIPFRC